MRTRLPLRGVLIGAVLFAVFFAVLLFADNLSSSKFIYVDF